MRHQRGIEHRRAGRYCVAVLAFGLVVGASIMCSDIPWWGGLATIAACLLVVRAGADRL